MSYTEQDLRESLRRTTSAPPPAPNRVALVELAVRRRRQHRIVATVAVVVLAILAVPVVRLLPDRLRHSAIPAGTSPAQVDAMMKYATFVASWSGISQNLKRPDSGVVGVNLTWNLPPYNCINATMDDGEPRGTQDGWILASPSAIGGAAVPNRPTGGVMQSVLWPAGVTSCDPPSVGSMRASGPAPGVQDLGAWDLAFGQELADPSRPALDVEGVFHAIPSDLVTDFGREVFASFEKVAPTSYGTDKDQLERVLAALGSWLGVGLGRGSMVTTSPVTGPTVIAAGSYVGTANLPSGYVARWDTTTGTFCVQGSVGSSGLAHLTEAAFTESHLPPTAPVEGPCG